MTRKVESPEEEDMRMGITKVLNNLAFRGELLDYYLGELTEDLSSES